MFSGTRFFAGIFFCYSLVNLALLEQCVAVFSTEQIGEQLENIIELIKKSMTGPALSFYEREFDFFHQITDISRIIKLVSSCGYILCGAAD